MYTAAASATQSDEVLNQEHLEFIKRNGRKASSALSEHSARYPNPGGLKQDVSVAWHRRSTTLFGSGHRKSTRVSHVRQSDETRDSFRAHGTSKNIIAGRCIYHHPARHGTDFKFANTRALCLGMPSPGCSYECGWSDLILLFLQSCSCFTAHPKVLLFYSPPKQAGFRAFLKECAFRQTDRAGTFELRPAIPTPTKGRHDLPSPIGERKVDQRLQDLH
jgi:hypothetical protein